MLRAERDWTQAQLADAAQVSRQTINAIETGRFDPSLPLAFVIAQIFGLTIEVVFDRIRDSPRLIVESHLPTSVAISRIGRCSVSPGRRSYANRRAAATHSS